MLELTWTAAKLMFIFLSSQLNLVLIYRNECFSTGCPDLVLDHDPAWFILFLCCNTHDSVMGWPLHVLQNPVDQPFIQIRCVRAEKESGDKGQVFWLLEKTEELFYLCELFTWALTHSHWDLFFFCTFLASKSFYNFCANSTFHFSKPSAHSCDRCYGFWYFSYLHLLS